MTCSIYTNRKSYIIITSIIEKQRYVLMCDITRNAGLVESKRTSVE